MTNQPTHARTTEAAYVQAFSTGWMDKLPDILVLSFTTHTGVHDFALTKEQALLIAKTMKETAARLAKPKSAS